MSRIVRVIVSYSISLVLLLFELSGCVSVHEPKNYVYCYYKQIISLIEKLKSNEFPCLEIKKYCI